MNLQKKSSKEFRSTFSDSSLKYEQAGYAYALLEFQCSPIKGLILRLLIEGKIDPAKEKALQNRYVRERVSQFCSKSKKRDRPKGIWTAKDFPVGSLDAEDEMYEQADTDFRSKKYVGLLAKIEIENEVYDEEKLYLIFIAKRVEEIRQILQKKNKLAKVKKQKGKPKTQKESIAMELNAAARNLSQKRRKVRSKPYVSKTKKSAPIKESKSSQSSKPKKSTWGRFDFVRKFFSQWINR